ncbi:DUF2945 domain-containing protein [Kytococcus sedentarius]|uniref:DUF2945 domain-containing protein n=1 Tax=Kytococcus sedentarius TaxID=1276 RepID=UPI00384BAB0E
MGLKKGDTVRWNTPQGETEGQVVEVRTEDFELEGQQFRASDDDPRYVVESTSTGKRAAHDGDALTPAGT